MNIFQQRVLEAVSELAAKHACIERIYIFGSAARGHTAHANDVDLAVEYGRDLHQSNALTECYGQFHSNVQRWALEQTELFGRPFRFSHVHYQDNREGDPIWQKIILAARDPVGSIGKATMAATDPK